MFYNRCNITQVIIISNQSTIINIKCGQPDS